MAKKAQIEFKNMRELFPLEGAAVTMRQTICRPPCGERPLLTARVVYPAFDFPDGAPACRINSRYAELAERFLAWCADRGAEFASVGYASDPDPARRFKHRRYLAYLHVTPGFVSPELISVWGEAAMLHGADVIGRRVFSECWRVRDAALIPWPKSRRAGEAVFISNDGKFMRIAAGESGASRPAAIIEDSIYEFRTISKLFATIR